ncbi:peptide deformylase [Pirellula staleyi DSM 6068]|uniref:Peptide deformylase n=1 Tax=Pirellula staleyi (strain ATCC 27377 / DSM 6068 / ICPB 4128) TaxID=530564 RepID=D2R5E8_PIRSD|nr:peptide deformylase [Pirellula staleyi DSM 6068]
MRGSFYNSKIGSGARDRSLVCRFIREEGTRLQIITYPHPTLRKVAKPIKRVDAELRAMVAQMFDLMYEAKGIGLAANQVDLPLRLFVINLTAEKGKGEELVFINPVLSHPKGSAEAEEGCLSLPGVYGQVVRPKTVQVNAYNLQGQEISAEVGGLLARCIQHENDHLDGVMFPDRMSESSRVELGGELQEFEDEFQSKRGTGEMPSDEAIAEQWKKWHERYC